VDKEFDEEIEFLSADNFRDGDASWLSRPIGLET